MLSFEKFSVKFPEMTKPFFTIDKLLLRKSEILMVSGLNGSGKSTFLKLLNNFEEGIVSGKIFWNKKQYHSESSILLPQYNQRIFFHNTLEEELNFFSNYSNFKKNTFINYLEFILDECYSETKKIPLYEIDNGRLKSINLLLTLLPHKELVLLDEPDAGFSYTQKKRIVKTIKELCKSKITIIVSHDVFFRNETATKILSFS